LDETTFTGERIPVSKIASHESEGYDEKNQILQGVIVISGNAMAEVTGTGTQTRFAKIAKTTSTVQADSDLVKGIDRISA
jgi:Mg2+-importing ATPase